MPAGERPRMIEPGVWRTVTLGTPEMIVWRGGAPGPGLRIAPGPYLSTPQACPRANAAQDCFAVLRIMAIYSASLGCLGMRSWIGDLQGGKCHSNLIDGRNDGDCAATSSEVATGELEHG